MAHNAPTSQSPSGVAAALRLAFAFAAALLAPIEASAQSRAGFDHDGLAKQALERHIRPLYDGFATTSAALKAAQVFCAMMPNPWP